MLAAAAAVSFPPAASSLPPVKPAARGWRVSWSRRAARVSAGYSQLEVRKVTYRPPGTEQNLLNEVSLSLRENRYFLADTVLEEVTFGWPRQKANLLFKEQLASKLQNAINMVGLTTTSTERPWMLVLNFDR